MSFPLMTITPKTRILVLATPLGCHLISFSCCIISKKHLCNEQIILFYRKNATTKIVFQLRKCVCAFVCVCVCGEGEGGGGGGKVIFLRGNGLHGRQQICIFPLLIQLRQVSQYSLKGRSLHY